MTLSCIDHEALAATRDTRYRQLWDLPTVGDIVGNHRDRRVAHRAIGDLARDAASAHERRLMHYLESNMDGARIRSCTAPLSIMAARTGLREAAVAQCLDALVLRGRVACIEYTAGQTGYRAQFTAEEWTAAKTALLHLWSRRKPMYSGAITDEDQMSELRSTWEETRLHWTREVWQSPLPGYVKSLALEAAQWVDATGDAPFCTVTRAQLSARTGYGGERLRQAIDVLTQVGLIRTDYRAGCRGGIMIWLRLPHAAILQRRYAAAGFMVEPASRSTSKPAKTRWWVRSRKSLPDKHLTPRDLLLQTTTQLRETSSLLDIRRATSATPVEHKELVTRTHHPDGK